MRCFSSLTDDEGVVWEIEYGEEMLVAVINALGEPVLDEDGRPRTTSRISEFVFRKQGERTWSSLPPWADVREEWKTNLCFFDEDEDGELSYWEVVT